MSDQPCVAQLPLFPETLLPPQTAIKPPSLHIYWLHAHALPPSVSDSPTILRCLELLGPLDWDGVPERNLRRNWGQFTIPYTALIAAELIKLNESLPSTYKLKRFLLEHPGFISLLRVLQNSSEVMSSGLDSTDVEVRLRLSAYLAVHFTLCAGHQVHCDKAWVRRAVRRTATSAASV
jgi:hypothetical protein